MHLYWVQSGIFRQQEAAGCPLWERPCAAQSDSEIHGDGSTPTLYPCEPTPHLTYLRAGSSCQGKETQREGTEGHRKRHMERDTVGAQRSILGGVLQVGMTSEGTRLMGQPKP